MNQTNTVEPLEQLAALLASLRFDPWDLLKTAMMIILALYLAFAIIVVRQTSLMIKTLQGDFKFPIRLVAWLHLLVVMGIIGYAWMVL